MSKTTTVRTLLLEVHWNLFVEPLLGLLHIDKDIASYEPQEQPDPRSLPEKVF
jgi:hypothetical protein